MRSRTLKPEFYQDEDVARLSPMARLLFQGLWLCSDRRGRLEDRPQKLRALLFPYEPAVDIEALISELASAKVHGNGAFVTRYEVDGRKLLQVNTFEKHQHCHPREPDSVLPGPVPASRVRPRPGNVQPCTAAAKTSGPSGPSDTGPSGPSVVPGCAGGTTAPPVLDLVAQPEEPEPEGNWSREACDDWISRFGGTAPGGRIGKALKPLVKAYGWREVRPAWACYLALGEAEFASPQRFAATYGRWSGDRPEQSARSPGGYDQAVRDSMAGAAEEITRRRAAREAARDGSSG
jgi:hypothetical protein